MSQSYSQTRALWAISKASFRSIFKSPQAVFFGLFFPIVLIVVFASIGRGGGVSFNIAIDKNSDTTSAFYDSLKASPFIKIIRGDEADIIDRLKKGRITALVTIKKGTPFEFHLTTSSANQQTVPALRSFLQGMINEATFKQVNENEQRPIQRIGYITVEQVQGRTYRMIDFYLPGMIGFSLIGSAVFGVSFVFFNLRETLVLKRMYASPVNKSNIVIGESLARIAYQLLTVIVLILFGTYAYKFTLSNGFVTFLELMIISTFALIVFMGFGFLISSVAKNQNVIPIYANLFMFPQYFLSGTFFPKTALPQGIQWLVEILPLTVLNDALRKVAFEGSHLNHCLRELGILSAWGIVVYIIAIKVFKWE